MENDYQWQQPPRFVGPDREPWQIRPWHGPDNAVNWIDTHGVVPDGAPQWQVVGARMAYESADPNAPRPDFRSAPAGVKALWSFISSAHLAVVAERERAESLTRELAAAGERELEAERDRLGADLETEAERLRAYAERQAEVEGWATELGAERERLDTELTRAEADAQRVREAAAAKAARIVEASREAAARWADKEQVASSLEAGLLPKRWRENRASLLAFTDWDGDAEAMSVQEYARAYGERLRRGLAAVRELGAAGDGEAEADAETDAAKRRADARELLAD